MTEFAITPSKILLDTYILYQNDRQNVRENMLYKTQFWFSLRKVTFVAPRLICTPYEPNCTVSKNFLIQHIPVVCQQQK